MVFAELLAKISLNSSDFNRGLDEATEKAHSFGSGAMNIIGAATKAVVAGVATGAAAVTAMTKQAVSAYGEYEQLVGGVQKLYGNMGMSLQEYADANGGATQEVINEWSNLEIAQNRVLENARQAYKTSGVSMNEYMDTATQFSAALINSLEGDSIKAADMTDLAMRAISDNFNTFGGDMEMITNAYKGFAKQNYSLLDNLKLGYGQSKSEMERLIADANEYADSIGEASDMSIDSFADIVRAIDLIQQKQGIAGTTQREAATTIQGSLGMAKAAWQNLLVGIADGDTLLDSYIEDLVDSVATLGENILPVVETALSGIGDLVTQLAPVIAERLPQLISDVLPSLLEAGANLVSSLASGIAQSLPILFSQAVSLLLNFANYIYENLDTMLDSAGEILGSLVDGLIEAIPKLALAAGQIIVKLGTYLGEHFGEIVSKGLLLVGSLIKGITLGFASLLFAGGEMIAKLIQPVVDKVKEFISIGADIVDGLKQGISNAWSSLTQWFSDKISGLVNGVKKFLGISSPSKVFKQIGGFMAEGLGEGWSDEIDDVKKSIYDDMDFGSATMDMNGNTDSRHGMISVVQNIYSKAQTAADLMQEAVHQQERAVMLGV